MIFAAIKNEIKDALLCFCLEQCSANGGASVCEVENLVNKAFEVFAKNPSGMIDSISLYRYHLYAGEKYTEEIFPDNIKENGVICERCLHLGTFLANEYSNNTDKIISRGYDLVYDLDIEQMLLIYRVVYSDNDVVTIYRVETEWFEDFDVTEFMLDLTAQITAKLNQNGNIILGRRYNVQTYHQRKA